MMQLLARITVHTAAVHQLGKQIMLDPFNPVLQARYIQATDRLNRTLTL